jgi:RHS repeat-associated protein
MAVTSSTSGSLLTDTLEEVIQDAQALLSQLFGQARLVDNLITALGEDWNVERLGVFLQDWNAGDFSVFPPIELRSQAELGGAKGAYSGERDTVYLAQELLAQNTDNASSVVDVLLEEIGHFLDQRLAVGDTPGDEGAIFSAVVRGEMLSPQQLVALQAEDDHAVIELDGEEFAIEKADIEYGDSVESSIDVLGEEDSYNFTGTVGDRVVVRMNEDDLFLNPTLELYAPDGSLVTEDTDDTTAVLDSILLDQAGIYTLLASDDGGNNTGAYSLSIQSSNNPGGTRPINFGESVTDAIDISTEFDAFTFTGAVGDRVVVRMNEDDLFLNPTLELYAPDGSLVTEDTDDTTAVLDSILLDQAGIYTLLASDDGGNNTGAYSLSIQSSNNPGGTRPINFGESVTDAIDISTEFDAFTFTGAVGDRVVVRMNEDDLFLNPTLELYAPDGSLVTEDTDDTTAVLDSILLDQAGIYTLLASDDGGNNTGAYSLSIQSSNNPGGTRPINFGESVTDAIDISTEFDAFTFTGAVGDRVVVRMNEDDLFLNPTLELYAPDGSLVTEDTDDTTAVLDSILLDQAGTYTLLASDDGGNSTGAYSLFVQSTNNPSGAVPIGFGDSIWGIIESGDEVDFYNFEASAGDILKLQITDSLDDLNRINPYIELYDTSGSLVAVSGNNPVSSSTNITTPLAEAGTYTLWISDYLYDDSGSYNFSLDRVNTPDSALEVFYGSNIHNTISPSSDLDSYIFSGVMGDPIRLRMEPTTINLLTPRLELYDDAGNLVESAGNSVHADFAQIETQLPKTGTYTLFASDFGTDQVSEYNLAIDRVFAGGIENNTYNLDSTNVSGSTIEDLGGSDTANLAGITLALQGLQAGITGFARDNENLIIDINQDGVASPIGDLTISNFFVDSAFENQSGFGFIETIDGISATDILDLELIDIDITDLGILNGTQTVNDYVGDSDFSDLFRFELTASSDVGLAVSELGADTTVLLQLLNSSGSVIATSENTLSTSDLAAGTYYARVAQETGNTNYALQITDKGILDLASNSFDAARNLGVLEGTQTVSDFVGISDPKDLYRFQLAEHSTVDLLLNNLAADADLQLRDGNGGFIASANLGGTNNETLSHDLVPGTYYVQVDSHGGDTNYDLQLTGTSVPFQIRGITPDQGSNAGQVTITIEGNQFTSDASLALIADNGASLTTEQTTWLDGTTLSGTFDLTGTPLGIYDLQVTSSLGTALADDVFTVNAGEPGQLALSLTVPSVLRPWQTGETVITYENIGETDIVAPLLLLEVEGGSIRRPLAPLDSFSESSLQLVGIGSSTAGVIAPGETGTISLPFRPESGAVRVDFDLSTAKPDGVVDWDAFKQEARPVGLSDEAWDAIWANFIASVGSTGGEYEAVLAENATRLGELDSATTDAQQLLGFELRQASNFGNLLEQYNLGLFGRGRTLPWDIQAIADGEGNVTIQNNGGLRIFEQLADGSYQSQSGDYGTLTQVGGVYQLQEQNGTVLAFRADGKLDFIEDTNGNRTTTTYNGSQLTGITDFDGYSLSFSYTPQGRIGSITDEAGRTTTYSYDAAGEHLLAVTDPLGRTTSYTYDANHGITSITNSDGTQALFSYDGQGRLTQQSLTAGAETLTYSYDAAGGVTATDATGATTEWLVNGQGQVGQMEDALGRVTRFRYDTTGNLTQLIAPGNTASSFSYDTRGNLLSQIDPEGNRVQFTYEPNFDQLASVSDPKNNVTSYSYDLNGNLTAITYADDTAENYGYDPRGNLTSFTNRRGQTLTYSYDSNNQLISKTLPDGATTTYTYDAVGNLTSATDASGTLTLAYDAANQLTQITYPNGRSLSYGYDAAGRRTQMVNQDGYTVTYGYDDAGRLTTVSDGGASPLVTYSYDSVGRLEQEVNGNGTTTTYSYDAASQLLSIVNGAPGGSVNSRFDYTYDELGRRTTMTTLEGTWTYGYDASGQLTAVTLPNGRHIEYAYDAAGNRITVNDDGVTTDYSTNNLNQYTSVGDATQTYDADGNLIAKTENGDTTTYTYNAENRLIQVVNAEGIWAYEYDALGNRIASTLNGERTEYLVDPTGLGDVVGEYGNSGNLVANYVHGLGLETRVDASSNIAFYEFDAIGSTTGLTGDDGDYLNQYSYLPFGEELIKAEGIENPFEYVGRSGVINEDNGLSFMRARFYSDETGHFITKDPIGLGGRDTNFYSYVSNDPLSGIDPSGLTKCHPETAFSAIGGGLGWWLGGIGGSLLGAAAGLGIGTVPATIYGGTFGRIGGRVVGAGIGAVVGDIVGGFFCPPPESEPNSPPEPAPPKPAPPEPPPGSPSPNDGAPGDGSHEDMCFVDPPMCMAPPPEEGPDVPGGEPGDGSPGAGGSTDVPQSRDPNDIVGPAGFGPEGWLTPNQVLPYSIRFENDEDATAPAVFVTITQQLDADLDWTSVELSDFGFSNLTFDVPKGLQTYSERLDLIDEIGYFLDVDGKVDPTSGELIWNFRTIDPATGDLPADPFAGFLPPNDDNHIGEGFISYRVNPLAGLPTGTEITALADIIFDTNDPIRTDIENPAPINTIDRDAPDSAVALLPDTTITSEFTVSWGGSDLGSGIATYDIFVAENDGDFTLWLDDTIDLSAIYTGVDGNTYDFYSVATDNVGLTEAAPTTADTTTTIAAGPTVIATAFDVTNDHVLLGQAHLNLTLENQGSSPIDTFEVQVVYSDDDIIGNADDQVVGSHTMTDLLTGLSVTDSLTVQLPQDLLNSRAQADDPPGMGNGHVSSSTDMLALVTPTGDVLAIDDITYFPWDIDGNGQVTPSDAIYVINRLGQTTTVDNAWADFDGSGQITPSDAIASINRLGYSLNVGVVENLI